MTLPLDKAQKGLYIIQSIKGTKPLRNLLMSLGFLKGSEVEVEKNLKDMLIVRSCYSNCPYSISKVSAKDIIVSE